MATSKIPAGKLVQTNAVFSTQREGFIPSNGLLPPGQVTLVARNINNGSLYVLWHQGNTETGKFIVGAVISGSVPTDGDLVALQYKIQ